MIVLFILLLFSLSVAQPCEDNLSVDLSNATFYTNGTAFYKGVVYPPHWIYNETVNGAIKSFGCLCNIKKCVTKCCPFGFVKTIGDCQKDPERDIILNKGLDLANRSLYTRTVNLSSEEFAMLLTQEDGSLFCADYLLSLQFYVQEDGKLFVETLAQMHNPDKYCIDTFSAGEEYGNRQYQLQALVCFDEDLQERNFILNSSCMLVSCVFILATCAVYAWLPELRNLHGRVLIAYLLSLFVAFLFMGTMQILLAQGTINRSLCHSFTFIIYFAFESAFFWLNVMCFDIWWTFSGKRGLSLQRLSTRARFNAYAAYAFGCPTLLTIVLAGLEFSGLHPRPWLPQLRNQGCFLYGYGRKIYLYGPMTILCIINIVFFVLTALKIVQIKRQTAVLKSNESTTHDTHRTDKQRLLLYVKLFLIMGVSWILEVLSALYPHSHGFWKIIDAYNVLIGVTIFIIFVCKRKIFRLIKKRYKQLRRDPMTQTQTTSSRTMSSKEEYQMGSIKK